MELLYSYSNGTEKKHTKFINKKTMQKECGNSKLVAIFKIHAIYKTEEKNEYITTLLLK